MSHLPHCERAGALTSESRSLDNESAMRTIHDVALGAVAAVLIAGCADLKNQLPNPVSSTVTIHSSSWSDSTAGTAFHGEAVKAKLWETTECRSCHGGTYLGGTSGVSCYSCHSSYPHEAKFTTAANGHYGYLKTYGFPLPECKNCHGASYTGGTSVNVSCSKSGCHESSSGVAKSPEACNTCHGTFTAAADDTLSWAPPRAVSGDTATSSYGVGAHGRHLYGGGSSAVMTVACSECHTVPGSIYDAGHMNNANGRATMAFGGMATLATNGITPAASYSTTALQCSNTYCHGAWQLTVTGSSYSWAYDSTAITGSFGAPSWTAGSSAAACGSCHGLPPAGHKPSALTFCSSCHIGVMDASGNIVDKTKHMNGKVNVFNLEYDFR